MYPLFRVGVRVRVRVRVGLGLRLGLKTYMGYIWNFFLELRRIVWDIIAIKKKNHNHTLACPTLPFHYRAIVASHQHLK